MPSRYRAVAGKIPVEGLQTRPKHARRKVAEWLGVRNVRGVLVTTADGELVGYVRGEDVR